MCGFRVMKELLIELPESYRQTNGLRRARFVALLGVAAILFVTGRKISAWKSSPLNRLSNAGSASSFQQNDDNYFDWESLAPSRDLDYVPCYKKFQCARLLLPMDWTAPEETQRDHEFAIAMVKQPANVSILDPRYGGEVYLNPGGPGAQGVTFLSGRSNDHLVTTINGDDPEGKVFDLVSFDPRGVGFSTPRISCFDDLVNRQLWHQLGSAYGNIDVSGPTFDLLWARAKSLEKLCDTGSPDSERSLALSTVTTPFVARDMLAMVEKAGEARERRVREALNGAARSELPDSLQYRPGKELLQYWGFSYGAFLGGTFASLYPDRVGRMVVDGCGDWVDSASGEFKSFLIDTETEWREFFNLCHAAGAERCALYSSEGAESMQKSVHDLLESLEHDPISVMEDGMPFPELFTKDTLIEGIFGTLYRPYRDRSWVKLAETISALLNGTVTPAAVDMLPSRKIHTSTSDCETPDCVGEGIHEGFWSEINFGVYCPDGLDFRNLTKAQIIPWVQSLQEQSPLFGSMFATTSKLPCVGYPVRPKWRFAGPFGGKTKVPMLFIGNTLDPVAPLEGTKMNVPLFEGARLLQQDSVGHCSTNAPSRCTVSHVRQYLVFGELPEEGTICPVDYLPFDAVV
ncbi:hypothetical protein CkaCkLH20_11523 [Colletotrichum karsti]|uniref:Peptidase S33 tripeptidyl aminopeptidase-like C-terminal domain-containing protein n=1 Tax=Colletotrichum karsti TaxID=1095194 RepID=A0A9P6HXY7_9PEZI|nr:uncharacterized protein CkaCkLH20_11523 [Colletotrichum karsti]KAF9871106.1 hypothetical protein CkaCkLH20_11523 [Colletotrichum karsti]